MQNNASTSYSALLVIGDFIAILAGFVASYIIRVSLDNRPLVEEIPALNYLWIVVTLAPLWIIVFASLGLYKESVYERRLPEMGRILIGSFVGILLVIGYEFVSNEPIFPARLIPLYALGFAFALLILERSLLWQVRKLMFRYGWWVNRVMVIGSNSATKDLARILGDTKTSGYNIVSIIGAKTVLPKSFTGKHFSDLGLGLKEVKKLNIHTLVQTRLYEDPSKNQQIADVARDNHAAYKFVPSEAAFTGGKPAVELFHYFPVISVHRTALLGWGRIAKRIFDFAVSLIAIIILSPVMLLTALAIMVLDPGPPIFGQKRLTRFGNNTKIYKFRSYMVKYSGKDPVQTFKDMGKPELAEEFIKNRSKVDNDPRISAVGRFIRATSLDELPQLFNVLKGDISLVGPRAIPEEELKDYEREKPVLLSVKTGITGLAQVTGRSDISMDERIRLDLYYVQNWSFWLDIRIIIKTVWVVLGKFGAK